MIKKWYKIIILNSILIIFSVAYQTHILKYALKYSESLSATVILMVMFLSIFLFGYRNDNRTRIKRKILYKTIIIVILYFLISYLCGFVIGYNRNVYSAIPILVLNNIFMPLVVIICVEVYRYVVCTTRSKFEVVITTLTIIIFEIMISMRLKYLLSLSGAFKYITITILPIIIKNIYLTYLTKHGGLKSTLVYRVLIDTYILFFPIVPAFSDYLNSMFKICLPILSFIYISRTVDQDEIGISKNMRKSKLSIVNIILITFIVIFISLLSGVFTYSLLGVGSNSMSPKIDKGDAVIIKKVKNSEIKMGNVIAYENSKNGKIIIHRLVEIEEDDNGKVQYVTKGDANKNVDSVKVTYKKIKGVVKLKIKYIAWPSIYLHELLK